jgi:hypothetical protein
MKATNPGKGHGGFMDGKNTIRPNICKTKKLPFLIRLIKEVSLMLTGTIPQDKNIQHGNATY